MNNEQKSEYIDKAITIVQHIINRAKAEQDEAIPILMIFCDIAKSAYGFFPKDFDGEMKPVDMKNYIQILTNAVWQQAHRMQQVIDSNHE